jgi:hypothetical protein
MSTNLKATRTVQYPLVAEFTFEHDDWVIDSADGAKKTLGSTVALSKGPAETGLTGPVANTITFDCIPLPPGAVLAGGELIVEEAYAGSTAATITLGIAGALTGILGSTSIMAAANTRTALLLTTALQSNAAGANVRATIAYTVANATAGKIRVRLMYTVDRRANEVQHA